MPSHPSRDDTDNSLDGIAYRLRCCRSVELWNIANWNGRESKSQCWISLISEVTSTGVTEFARRHCCGTVLYIVKICFSPTSNEYEVT